MMPDRFYCRLPSTRRAPALALALALAAPACTAAQYGPITELEPRQAGFLEALGDRDADRLATFFSEDGVLHVANMPPVHGRHAIHRFYQNVFRFLQETRATLEATRMAAAGDMAFTTGRVVNVFAGQDGPTEFTGKLLLVWERREGLWLVAAYALSSDHADPRPPGRPGATGR
jgi:uncharacterized protein (TIGR02246 family)